MILQMLSIIVVFLFCELWSLSLVKLKVDVGIGVACGFVELVLSKLLR